MNCKKGFTLVELVVVMVIIGILAVIAVPMYRGYVVRAQDTEGKILCGSVSSAEKVYYTEYGQFFYIAAPTDNDPVLTVDSRMNAFYNNYTVSADNPDTGGYAITSYGRVGTDAEGRTVVLNQPMSAAPAWQ